MEGTHHHHSRKAFVGTTRSVARSLLSALQSPELNGIPSVFGYRSELEGLQVTVKTIIDDVLRVVEAQERLSLGAQDWMVNLNDAIFKVDDLVDEFLTLAKHYQLLSPSQKVINFFSRSNNHPFIVAERMSREFRIRKDQLADLASKGSNFSFNAVEIDHQRKPETSIIERDNDLETIVNALLPSDTNNGQRDVRVLSIVGVGGVGKTALAQLVYNHPRVKDAFPFRLWTCVSAARQKGLNMQEGILSQMITRDNLDQCFSMNQLRGQLAGKRYLLVLDDVRSLHNWHELVGELTEGATGSCIVITTRSRETTAIKGGYSYQLSPLSKEDSWRLFESTAFASKILNPQLFEICQKIVNECAGIPLAIRVAGSLLYGLDTDKWLFVNNQKLVSPDNDIMPILKLSFDFLKDSLKSCLCYCTLFPNDYVIEKEMLISLWMAQGYIVPLREDQSLEDAAQEYFTILLHRCFLQGVEQNAYGEIISCKLQNLIRELAWDAAETEMCLISDDIIVDLVFTKHHLNFMSTTVAVDCIRPALVRSILYVGGWYKNNKMDQFNPKPLIDNYKCLRTLDLSNLGIKTLPNSIGELLHLRYLNLSRNRDLKVLPKGVTILVNLQTLMLNGCLGLSKLPEDLSKLFNLRVLDIKECSSLTCMPSGLGKLTSLHTLPEFVLGKTSLKLNQWFNQLEDLRALQSLKGHLTMRIESPRNTIYPKEDARWEGAYLSNKVYLNCIRFSFTGEEVDERGCHEELMGVLQPHANLKGLDVCGYDSSRMPGWITFLPNLVTLCLENCRKLQYLPDLGNLVHLKVFHLVNLLYMEYIFEYSTASTSVSTPAISAPIGSQSAEVASLFPSLQELHLINLPKLKGLFRSEVGLGVKDDSKVHLQSLLRRKLESLIVEGCLELGYVSLGSYMGYHKALLYRSLFNPGYEFEKIALLQLWLANGIFDDEETAGIFFEQCLAEGHFKASKNNFLPGEAMYKFTGDNHLVSNKRSYVMRIEDTFNSDNSHNLPPEVSHISVSCRNLNYSSDLSEFERFKQLRTLILVQGHLLSLRQVSRDFFLSLKMLRVLVLSHTRLEKLPSSIGCMRCLRYLDLTKTPIKHLPEALDCLEHLQTLKLRGCSNLSTLPKGMRKLEKLRHLEFDVLLQLRSMPEGMGALTNIRTLSAFIVGVEEGRNIRQLKNMNNISGSFCISGLENVLKKDEAVEAYMCGKLMLRKLELRWSDSKDKDISGHTEVLSSLQPHPSLEELRISCYGGSHLPWICDTAFSQLVNITLFKCDNCSMLPSFGQLPALESLNIVSFNELIKIKHEFYGGSHSKEYIAFPELTSLTIEDMPSLKEWSDTENPYFPKLLSLKVRQCPKLVSLCTLSSSLHPLKELEITQCKELASCFDEELPPPLETFIVEECPSIDKRILKNYDQWLKLLKRISDVWINHQQMLGSISSEVQEEEEEEKDEEDESEEEDDDDDESD